MAVSKMRKQALKGAKERMAGLRRRPLASQARLLKAEELRRNSQIDYLRDEDVLYFNFMFKNDYLRKNGVPLNKSGKEGYSFGGDGKATMLPDGGVKATLFYPFERFGIYQDRLKGRGITPLFLQELRMAYKKETGKPLRRIIIEPEGASLEEASVQGFSAYKSVGAKRDEEGNLVIELMPGKRMPHRR